MLAPRICCLDLDTFFVSVERLLDPSLNGRPVVVGGERDRSGVVTSCSYEARAFGIRSGMSIKDASKLVRGIRDVTFLPGHHELYGDYSQRGRQIVERFSPIVIAASIDEHYLDFSGCERLYFKRGDADGDATIARVVREITGAIASELGLPASAGIATSKSMAKVASALAKPRGVLLVAAGSEAATLSPLPVRRLPGIGPVAEAKLVAARIATLGELVTAPDPILRPIFGSATAMIRAAALGLGTDQLGRERPAFREHDPKGVIGGSISNERTFYEASAETAPQILSSLCERVCSRARRRGVLAGQVALKLRYVDFETLGHQRVLSPPTSVDTEVHRTVVQLYRETRTKPAAIRLLGVALAKFRPDSAQLPLLDRGERRVLSVDRVRDKYGYDAVHLASRLRRRR